MNKLIDKSHTYEVILKTKTKEVMRNLVNTQNLSYACAGPQELSDGALSVDLVIKGDKLLELMKARDLEDEVSWSIQIDADLTNIDERWRARGTPENRYATKGVMPRGWGEKE